MHISLCSHAQDFRHRVTVHGFGVHGSEVCGGRTEVRGQRTEDGRQITEGGGRRAKDGRHGVQEGMQILIKVIWFFSDI